MNLQLADGSFPLHYYGMIVGVYVVHQVFHNAMFVSIMAFFASISDPAVGGTYMTLLNTLTNLGGNWPATLALWAVDGVTVKQCSTEGSNACEDASAAEAERTRPCRGPPRRARAQGRPVRPRALVLLVLLKLLVLLVLLVLL